MKKFILIFLAMSISIACLAVENNSEEKVIILSQNGPISQEEIEDIKREAKETAKQIKVEMEDFNQHFERNFEKPYIGIYYENLTLRKAKDLDYKKFYGIVITGIVPKSPADYYNLVKNDILMKIDDNKMEDTQTFTNTIKSYSVGDTVNFKIFRNGKEKDMEFVFGSSKTQRPFGYKIKITKENEFENKKSFWKMKSIDGGLFWTPLWFKLDDIDDLNHIHNDFGFNDMKDDFIYTSGFTLKINPHKNYLAGLHIQKSEDKNKKYVNHVFTNQQTGLLDTVNVKRELSYKIDYIGGSIDRSLISTKNFSTTLGMMLGWGKIKYTIKETKDLAENEDFNGNIDWEDLEDPIINHTNYDYDYKNKVTLKKEFLTFQPRITMIYTFLDHLGIRAEIGYMYSYAPKDWKAKFNGESEQLENAPDTSFNGMTFSVGPWFSF